MKVVLVISAHWRLIMFITICLQKLISSGTAFNSFRFIGAGLTITGLNIAARASPCHKDGGRGGSWCVLPHDP